MIIVFTSFYAENFIFLLHSFLSIHSRLLIPASTKFEVFILFHNNNNNNNNNNNVVNL